MKILLLGEYSRLHNSLREGLTQLGHQVVIVSTGDGFKGYDADYKVTPKVFSSPLLRKLRSLVFRITKVDLERTELGLLFWRLIPELKGFDHVQLINSDALETHGWLARRIVDKICKQNGSLSLLICGDEPPVVSYSLTNSLKYSILTPYLNNKSLKNLFYYTLKYNCATHWDLFRFIIQRARCIITSDLDYEIPMKAQGYSTTFIPNPINTDAIHYITNPLIDKVIVFLGINRNSYYKKGINYFEDALEIVKKTHAHKVEILVTENIPYKEYITLYDKAHILLDQVYAYDQGYNALEAMTKGKVVFTGAETEFTEHYNITEPVNINALPDAEAIARELIFLIDNPEEIDAMGKRARAFIEQHHHYVKVAEQYLDSWLK
ncbi:glycosyltransferase [Flavobacterium sp. RNTU_13]|uniref:glycosyltransferase family protein n=1 Tax=Flavobacterium sp. RNTU_13 TaxID=3375145 RepID=UPI00398693F0